MDFNSPARLVRAFRPSPCASGDPDTWPAVPAAGQLPRDGLEPPPGVVILAGENGSGRAGRPLSFVACLGLVAPQARCRRPF